MRKVPIGPKTIVHAASVSNGRSRQPPSFLLLPFFPLLPLPLLLGGTYAEKPLPLFSKEVAPEYSRHEAPPS